MGLNIKNAEVIGLVRRLARERDVDLTEAVRLAVDGELRHGRKQQASRLRKVKAIAERVAALPIRDARSADEILAYDERGLPS